MVAYVSSYLFDRRTHLNDLRTRSTNVTQELWTQDSVAGPVGSRFLSRTSGPCAPSRSRRAVVARTSSARDTDPRHSHGGTFYQSDGAVFYDVHDPERTVVIDLDHEHHKRLVIEVDDSRSHVATLQSAIAGRAATRQS